MLLHCAFVARSGEEKRFSSTLRFKLRKGYIISTFSCISNKFISLQFTRAIWPQKLLQLCNHDSGIGCFCLSGQGHGFKLSSEQVQKPWWVDSLSGSEFTDKSISIRLYKIRKQTLNSKFLGLPTQDLLSLSPAIHTMAEVICMARYPTQKEEVVFWTGEKTRTGVNCGAQPPFVGQASSCLNWSLCAEWMAGDGGRDAQNCWQEIRVTDRKLTCL